MKYKLSCILLAIVLLISGCAKQPLAKVENERVFKTAMSFANETLDPHLNYQGWYTSIYGVTQTLFKMGNQSTVDPWLVESYTVEENTWTITLKPQVTFSNGQDVTADMVIRNLIRAGEINPRFAYLLDYQYSALDDYTLTIETSETYPTLGNDLASPELAIVDLDHSDFTHTLIATGPFIMDAFVPSGTVEVIRNEAYWNGDVHLDRAVFYYMPDPDTKLMAMQNGEIQAYNSVNAAAIDIFRLNPEKYVLSTVPATRLQFYILNTHRLSPSIRKAINLTVDAKNIETFLSGTVTAATGPFSANAAYGKVTKPAVDTQAAIALIQQDGYSKNANGYFEKDGAELTLNIAYYSARSLDTVAILMQEQLKNIGVKAILTNEEDPDGTYIATGDFDIALYSMIADKSGDPYYFISTTLAQDAPYNCGGYQSEAVEALIMSLRGEVDFARRADIANDIIQTVINDNAFGYIAHFNKVTVSQTGVSGIHEESPFDFYFIDEDTTIN